jgi:16S rRNA (guanine527-N7)-methyltransferase
MVIALMEPTAAVTLLEPIQKKARFLQAVKEKLGLENVRIIAERAEDFAKTYRSGFSIVSSRAVAHLAILLELSMPLLKDKGLLLAMKGAQGKTELTEAKNALLETNAKAIETNDFTLPKDYGKRTIIKIKKMGPTPAKYPRSFAQIKKKPL